MSKVIDESKHDHAALDDCQPTEDRLETSQCCCQDLQAANASLQKQVESLKAQHEKKEKEWKEINHNLQVENDKLLAQLAETQAELARFKNDNNINVETLLRDKEASSNHALKEFAHSLTAAMHTLESAGHDDDDKELHRVLEELHNMATVDDKTSSDDDKDAASTLLAAVVTTENKKQKKKSTNKKKDDSWIKVQAASSYSENTRPLDNCV